MGGVFKAPKAPSVPVYSAPAATDPEAAARKQRQEAIARNRRGRFGLVTTSDRGILERATENNGKSLLGE